MLVAKFSHCCYEIVKIANQHFIVYQKKKVFFSQFHPTLYAIQVYTKQKKVRLFSILHSMKDFSHYSASHSLCHYFIQRQSCA